MRILEEKVDYVDHTIISGKLEMSRRREKKLLKPPLPSDKDNMRFLLGPCNGTGRLVPKCRGIARPLKGMIRKEVDENWKIPTVEPKDALEKPKTHLANPTILGLQRMDDPIWLIPTQANMNWGPVLLQ